MTNSTPKVTQLDYYIAQQKRDLSHLEWDDPEFDTVTDNIVEGYRDISRGETHYVPF
jgi:hypothetical protein